MDWKVVSTIQCEEQGSSVLSTSDSALVDLCRSDKFGGNRSCLDPPSYPISLLSMSDKGGVGRFGHVHIEDEGVSELVTGNRVENPMLGAYLPEDSSCQAYPSSDVVELQVDDAVHFSLPEKFSGEIGMNEAFSDNISKHYSSKRWSDSSCSTRSDGGLETSHLVPEKGFFPVVTEKQGAVEGSGENFPMPEVQEDDQVEACGGLTVKNQGKALSNGGAVFDSNSLVAAFSTAGRVMGPVIFHLLAVDVWPHIISRAGLVGVPFMFLGVHFCDSIDISFFAPHNEQAFALPDRTNTHTSKTISYLAPNTIGSDLFDPGGHSYAEGSSSFPVSPLMLSTLGRGPLLGVGNLPIVLSGELLGPFFDI